MKRPPVGVWDRWGGACVLGEGTHKGKLPLLSFQGGIALLNVDCAHLAESGVSIGKSHSRPLSIVHCFQANHSHPSKARRGRR